jgi:hypothetical protein
MAQRTIVELTDDLDGSQADESVRFSLDGKSYEIDLSAKNADKLRESLAPYVGAGRRAGIAKVVGRAGSAAYDPAAVRAWASSNGYQVSSRGRVSRELVEAFRAAGN